MSDAKRFEDWIIFDAHEFQYPDGNSMSGDSFAFQLELQKLQALQVKWDAIPWSTLNHCELILTSYNRLIESVDTQNRADEMREWLDANAPKELAK